MLRHATAAEPVAQERGQPLPDAAALGDLCAQYRERVAAMRDAEQARRTKAEAVDLQRDWYDQRRLVYRWIRNVDATPPVFLRRGDGSLSANLDEMLGLIRGAWMPFFRKYDGSQEPDVEEFLDRYRSVLDAAVSTMRVTELTVADVRLTLARMAAESATNSDGLTVRELQALPDSLLELFVGFLNLVEEVGEWPEQLLVAMVSLIPKGEGSSPLDLRPISILAVAYRVWSSTRFRVVAAWAEQWLHPRQTAYRSELVSLRALCWRCAVGSGAPGREGVAQW